MANLSIWQADVRLPAFPHLEGDVSADVLIIGGGIAGILTAFFLQKQGISTILAEKGRICSGITGHTTAKITAQHGLIYHKLLKSGGMQNARMYLRANLAALDEYVKLCQNIDCDFERKDNYVYSTDNRRILEEELDALRRIGAHPEICERLPLPIPTVGAVVFRNQAQFHPLKFLAAIARGLNIYEHTFVREMIGTAAVTDRGRITAKRVIVTTHFPFLNKHGSYFLKLYQHRSYVLALKNAVNVDGMFADEDKTGYSFRNYKDYLLLGGGGHRTGKKGGNYAKLHTFAAANYPDAQVKFAYAAQDCMSLDGIPYIGRYSARTRDLYVATGFNKWGMTSAMAAAMLLSDAVQGKKNEFAVLFDPSRSILKPQLLINGLESTVGLLTPSKKRCPHLGCALKWNPAEHSYDCPCHGSRFSSDGKVLDNPANGNLK